MKTIAPLLLVTCVIIGNVVLAQPHRDSLMAVTVAHSSDTLAVLAFADLCYEYRFINQDSALLFAKQGIELGQKLNYQKGLAQIYSDAAFVHFDKSDFNNALVNWSMALHIAKALSDQPRLASLHMKLGACYFKTADYEKSLHHQLQALRTYEKLKIPQGIGHAMNNIAAVYEHQNLLDKAYEYYNEALALYKTHELPLDIGAALINLGNVRFLKEEFNAAKVHYLQSLTYLHNENTASPTNLSIAYNNLSEIYIKELRLDSALYFSERALQIRRTAGDYQGVVSSLNMLGRIQTRQGKWDLAERTLRSALDSATRKHLIREESRVHQNLSELFQAKNEPAKALQHFIRYATLKDTLLNETGRKTISTLQIQYETEKKQQQIALQNAQLAEQKAQIQRDYFIISALIVSLTLLGVIFILLRNRQRKKRELLQKEHELTVREAYIQASINSQENERKRFAQDLHDGMGQWISALRITLSNITGAPDDQHKLEVVERSEKIMEEMNREFRSIAFNLMPQTLIQYGLKPALEEMALRINHTGRIIVRVQSFEFPQRLSELQEISLYRIVQEWTNNIIKYASASTIDIQLIGHEREVNVMIEDNGKGFMPETLENANGNGWKNIRIRLKLIKGDVTLDSHPDRIGTTFSITAPIHLQSESVEPRSQETRHDFT